MEQKIIRVDVPSGIDLNHTIKAVTDALCLSENVTQDEYNLVERMLEQLRDYGSMKIAAIWSTEDVLWKAEEMDVELTEEDAEWILSEVDRHQDSSLGITWTNIEYEIEEYLAVATYTYAESDDPTATIDNMTLKQVTKFIEQHNELFGTTYKSVKEFNEGEAAENGIRRIYIK